MQSTRRETVLSNDVLRTMPATRSYTGIMSNIASLMPTGGVGAETNPGQINRFTAHGGRQNEGRISVNGLLVTEPGAGAGVSSLAYDVANVDEIQVLVSGGLGEAETGGPIMNLVPRSGGNKFAGSAFYSGAGELVPLEQRRRRAAEHRDSGTIRADQRVRRERLPSAVRFCGTACGSSAPRGRSGRPRRCRGPTPTSTPGIRRIGTTRATSAS